jgi:hypothetical protein
MIKMKKSFYIIILMACVFAVFSNAQSIRTVYVKLTNQALTILSSGVVTVRSGGAITLNSGATLTASNGSTVTIPIDDYGADWSGSSQPATKDDIYDKIETLGGSGDMLGANNLSDVSNAATSRTNLGLGTANSPEFTAVNVGAATDTTIARSGAGAITVEGVGVLLSGGALGTPSSGTLTNATGLPLAGVVDSTSEALGAGSIELGAAADTTIARSGAGMATIETKGIITRVITTAYITGSAATHTFTTGMQYCEVWCTGEGGGGGGARASDSTSSAGAAGGGSGGTAYTTYTAAEAGADAVYTVGTTGGAGGSNIGGNGTTGQDSTFNPAGTGATLTGSGGNGGTGHDNATPAATMRAGAVGGSATGGLVNLQGGHGGAGLTGSITTYPGIGGGGGGSIYGNGGGMNAGSAIAANGGQGGAPNGSGGAGAAALNATAGTSGGNGAVGLILVKEYCQ